MFDPLRNETAKAHEMTLAGKSVVLVTFPRYCRYTDGFLGCETVVDQVYDTLAQAETSVEHLSEYHDADSPEYFVYQVPAPQIVRFEAGDDSPF